ncbi:unnamed protein product [Prunus armeniaca]|uniref:Uncharacterized protein n=1 Tax=Prunus armeniaca TaxID=36596 RepID=A0A6J5Y715_PRUAR|nr:unnamed protein product [Prunus armeniaca]
MAEKSNALTVKEIVLQVDHLLFLVERLAIFLVIIFPKFSCFSFIYFILTTFLCMEASLQRQLVSKSTPNYQHVFVFLLERAATIFLVLYNWATNYWYIAMASLVISATCSACILNFMPWQKFHKNGIPCPNPCSSMMNLCFSVMNLWKDKERMFLLERLAVIVFVLYPRSATPFADFFCFSCILDLIRSALRLNPNETEQGDGYLFRIERAMAILLKLHCTKRNIFIARETEIEEESAKEENTKWEEGLVEADGQLKGKAESAAGASKRENNKWEGDWMQEDEDQLKEKPDTEEENTKREDDLLEVDDSWEDLNSLEEVDGSWEEELVEADEIDSVSEITNLMKKGEVEGNEEVERLRAENESLKREKYLLRQRLEREREAYEQEYKNMLKKMQEEFEGTLMLERQLSTIGCHNG